MAIRYLKITLVVIISLLCLVYASQNVANLEAAYQAFAYVTGMADHTVYPSTFGTAIHNPVLVWATLAIVILCEYAAGLLAAKGAWDLWAVRKTPAAQFNAAKTFALLGCGMGIVVWLGFFGVTAGAYFQMWQTEIGQGSLQNAFQFFGSCAIVFLIVNMADD
jgi:predicted small integral membrane protein